MKKIIPILLALLIIAGVATTIVILNNDDKKETKEESKDKKEDKENKVDKEEQVENNDGGKTYEPKCTATLNNEEIIYSQKFNVDDYETISDYLKSVQNLKVVATYFTYDSELELNIEKIKELTDVEIEMFLNEMNASEVKAQMSGMGGHTGSYLEVSYIFDNNNMKIKFGGRGFSIVSTNDGNIIKILDNKATGDFSGCSYLINTGDTVYNIIEQLKVEAER